MPFQLSRHGFGSFRFALKCLYIFSEYRFDVGFRNRTRTQKKNSIGISEIDDRRFQSDLARSAIENIGNFFAEGLLNVPGCRRTDISERIGARSSEGTFATAEKVLKNRMIRHADRDRVGTGGGTSGKRRVCSTNKH